MFKELWCAEGNRPEFISSLLIQLLAVGKGNRSGLQDPTQFPFEADFKPILLSVVHTQIFTNDAYIQMQYLSKLAETYKDYEGKKKY